MTLPLIYLASPYSDPDPSVRQRRYECACRAAARLLVSQRCSVFSPIAHSHPVAQAGAESVAWQEWMEMDRRILRICDRAEVLMIEGWRSSCGVAQEMALAHELGKPVGFLTAEWARVHGMMEAQDGQTGI